MIGTMFMPTTKLNTIEEINAAMASERPDYTAIASSLLTLNTARERTTMVDTIVLWNALGNAAIGATRQVTPDADVTKFAAIATALSLKVGASESTFGGWSRSAVSNAFNVTRAVPLITDPKTGKVTLPDLAAYEEACEASKGKLSPRKASNYVTWMVGRLPGATTSNNATDATPDATPVKTVTVGVKERRAAIDRLAKADLASRVVESAPITFGDLRLVSDADLNKLLALVTAEIDARKTRGSEPSEPSVPDLPDFTKMTKAQIVAWQASLAAK